MMIACMFDGIRSLLQSQDLRSENARLQQQLSKVGKTIL